MLAMKNWDGRPASIASRVIRLMARASLLCLLSIARASTQGAPPNASDTAAPDPSAPQEAEVLPKDPLLREQFEATLVAMHDLVRSTDEVIRNFDARIDALAKRLLAQGESAVAGRLYGLWGVELDGNRGRPQEALTAYERAQQIFARIGDRRGIAKVAQNRGIVFDGLSRHDEALAEFDKAGQAFEQLEDEVGVACVAINRGNVFITLSRHEDALAEFGDAARVFARFDDQEHLADVAIARGQVLAGLSRYEQALSEFETAASIYTKRGDKAALADIALSRASVLSALGRHDAALADLESAADCFEERGDGSSLAYVHRGRGEVLVQLSRREEALAEFDAAENAFERVGSQYGLSYTALYRGDCLAFLERYEEALVAFAKADSRFEKMQDAAGRALTALGRADVFCCLARPADATLELDKAARAYEEFDDQQGLAAVARGRGKVLRLLHREPEALVRFAEAAARVETVLQSQVQKLGEATSSAFRGTQRSMLWETLGCAASIAELTDSQRGIAYKVFGTFTALGTAETIAERGRVPALRLDDAERQRLRQLTIDTRRAVSHRDELMDLREADPKDEKHRILELGAIVEKLRKLELESSRLIETARVRQQVYVGIQYPRAASVEEVQAELDPGVALLEYAVEDGQIFAFVTTRCDQRLVTLGDAAEVVADIDHVSSTMTAKHRSSPDAVRCRRLGTRLVDPLLCRLGDTPKVTTLLIACAGDLARVPFELLLVRVPGAGETSRAETLLLNAYDMAYVHSGTVMRAMRLDSRRRVGPRSPEFVGFGYPLDADVEGHDDRPESGLDLTDRGARQPLTQSAAEVLEIAGMFASDEPSRASIVRTIQSLDADETGASPRSLKGERFELFLGSDATEQALKQNPKIRTARVVHLACHGEADLVSPALSRLVLSRSRRIEAETGEDGYVYVRELRDLELSAELLVLSACETNAGKSHPVEGIAGLSSAGLAAGAEAVISTFWQVDDRAARELMVDFHQRWSVPGTTRIAALCAAKRKAIQRGVSIKTWSAYALWDARTR